MQHGILQLVGGIFYLLNKIFFSLKERSGGPRKRRWSIAGWAVYIIGLPSWVILFFFEKNWMAAAVETGGGPAMVMGLINAVCGHNKAPRWLDHFARATAIIGVTYSVYNLGLMKRRTQWLELGVVVGFLVGNYLLAKERPRGYVWFMLMNAANAMLMLAEHYPWLFLQQVISIGFVIDAWRSSKRKKRQQLLQMENAL